MAYNELIKGFDRTRDYMREFYVYGFKSREQYTKKSSRSYDDERRRIESWLGDHMRFRRTEEGRNVFLSIDSRVQKHNPLYRGWKACSFTDGEITLHFIIMDILYDPNEAYSVKDIVERISGEYSEGFEDPRIFDESTVRKKLEEYTRSGILEKIKDGRVCRYRRSGEHIALNTDVLDFFSEAAPLGVIGSYILDKTEAHEERFAFKHHYIAQALDSEILYDLFAAMRARSEVWITNFNRRAENPHDELVVPLRVFISVQSGRQYLIAYRRTDRRMRAYRIDYIQRVKQESTAEDYSVLRGRLYAMQKHIWGVGAARLNSPTEHVEFTVCYEKGEEFIPRRLEREKRCGTVEQIDENHCRFTADVYDSSEMIPWIRTFICRITELHFSNKTLEKQFREDLKEMYSMYAVEDGETL